MNYDLPNGSDDFVHRIGRTGRAGATGVATTFVTPLEKGDARKLERELKIQFQWLESDKNLAKEERNKPVDLNQTKGSDLNSLLAMETRTWREDGDAKKPQAHQHGAHHPRGASDAGHGRSHAGGRSNGRPQSAGRSKRRRTRSS